MKIECSEQTEGVLLHDLHQLTVHFFRAALGRFDLHELAVHDGGAVGVDRDQQAVVFIRIVIAHGDGVHRVFVAVGRIPLVGVCLFL